MVIAALGAAPAKPPIPGLNKPHVVVAYDALLNPDALGQNVVVVGGGEVGVESGMNLAKKGHNFVDARFGRKKLFDDIKDDLQEVPHYGVPEKSGGPKWLGFVKGVAIVALVLFFFDMIQASRWGIASKPFLTDIAIMVGLAVVIVGITVFEKRAK